jgi:hypothetical protein
MAERIVKVQGWGIGTAKITAELDGQVVFSDDVLLVDFNEDNAGHKTAPTLFTFELPVDFSGVKPMKITVEKTAVRFGQIVANYTEVDWGETYYTGPYEFADIAPQDDQGSRDPRGNVRINEQQQKVDRQGLMGTWHWNINPGSVLEYDLRVSAGSTVEF